MFFTSRINKILFIIIFILAALLRLIFLSSTPIYPDEPAYSVRSIGLVDTLLTKDQQTPLDLVDKPAWWMSLSFHDHPPLIFIINHLFFNYFGNSLLVARLPSALFGLASVVLIFLLSKKLFTEKMALVVMALFAFNDLIIIFARIGMMESVSIFFILLTSYLFILSLSDRTKLIGTGISLGLGILTKYTILVIAPVCLIILLFFRIDYFKDKRLYLAGVACILVIMPVIIYNLFLYKISGHFDVQFASLLHQSTPEWTSLPGKDQRGDILERAKGIIRIAKLVSPLFIFMCLSSFFLLLLRFIKKEVKASELFLFLAALFYVLFILLTSGGVRFLVYPVVFLSILSGYLWTKILIKNNKLGLYLASLILIVELSFSINSIFLPLFTKPFGYNNITYAKELFIEDTAARQLDKYFTTELKGKASLLKPIMPNKGVGERIKKFQNNNYNKKGFAAIIVYDPRIDYQSLTWALHKRYLYQGWLVVDLDNLAVILDVQPELLSIKNLMVYYVATIKQMEEDKKIYRLEPTKFNNYLANKDIVKTSLFNNKNQLKFIVYKDSFINLKAIVDNYLLQD